MYFHKTFAAAIISGSALFAENTLHIGAGFPISILSVDIDGSAEDFNQNAYDFTIDYTHVFEKGFTLKGGIDVGYVTTSDVKSAVKGDDLGGLDFAVNLGLGGSPLHNEKMTLSILGTLGLRVQNFSAMEDNGVEDISTELNTVLFYIGPEVNYTFRFNKHIGMFADFGLFYNMGKSEYSVEDNSDDYDTSGPTFLPKIGVSVTF